MVEKTNGEQQKKEGAPEGKKKSESGGGKANANATATGTVVLKTDFHCEGCVSKILKCIRATHGVDTAKIGDGQITVIGKVDPVKLRDTVEKKTHKKVEVILPQSNKNGDGREKAKGKENVKQDKKQECGEKNPGNKSDEKKSNEKEPPITTAVLKVNLHCDGCIQKIRKIVSKTKGYRDVKVDKQKEMVTVTGAFDMKGLAAVLKKHLKREVQILPPKKEAEKKENAGGAKGKGGGEKGKSGGGEKGGGGGEKTEGNNKMQFQVANPYPYPYPFMYETGDQFQYNPYPYGFGAVHAPQMFSDENPNACSVM